jgi:uncharacterized membrane protein YgcG
LLDVLEAAGLDPTPAEEGIARCEEHLSAQVDALDTLNERYNEAMVLADDDPDTALERLEAIRDEKEDLRLEDGDLHASIEQLRSRIEERDAAREEIQEIKAQVEQHRHNQNWIAAAEVAQEILPLIDTAELPEERVATLRQFVATQELDRDEWAEERWMQIKDQADACVEEQQYLDAAEHLDDLKAVAPHTPFEKETRAFVEEVEGKADLEANYRQAVRNALEEAEVLRQDRVDPEEGYAVELAIETAEETYRALYGAPDLPTRPSLAENALFLTIDQKLGLASLFLTIDQKLGLALQLRTLAEYSPDHDMARQLSVRLRERRQKIRSLKSDAQISAANVVTTWPDHPKIGNHLESIIEDDLPLWASRDRLESALTTLKEIRGILSSGRVDRRIDKLTKRTQLISFEEYPAWLKFWTIFAFALSCGGVLLAIFQRATYPLIGAAVGVVIVLLVLLQREYTLSNIKGIRQKEIEKKIKCKDRSVRRDIQKCKDVNFKLSPDEYDGRAYTPLMLAARNGMPDVVEALLDAGADTRIRSGRRFTALIFAAYEGNVECAEHLIEAGANVDAEDINGLTALDWVEKEGESDNLVPPTLKTSYSNIREILVKEGASKGSRGRSGSRSTSTSSSTSSRGGGCSGPLSGVLVFLFFAAQLCG